MTTRTTADDKARRRTKLGAAPFILSALLLSAPVAQGAAAPEPAPSASAAADAPAGADKPTETSRGALFERSAEAVAPMRFRISPYQTTRLAFEGERIRSTVWDRHDLTVEAEPRTGEIFLLPKRTGAMQLYVTTETGETVSVRIDSDPEAAPQNIVLKRRTPKTSAARSAPAPTRDLPPLAAPDFEEAMKRFARAVYREEPTPDVERRPCGYETEAVAAARRALAPLEPQVRACWAANGVAGTVLHVRNRALTEALLNPRAVSGAGLLAVAADRTQLAPGQSARVLVLEARDE